MIEANVVFDGECIYVNDLFWINTIDEDHQVRRMGDNSEVLSCGGTLEQAIAYCIQQPPK